MKTNPQFEAETIIDIPFHDVDMMNITWHGHYVRYLEIARCTLFDKINYNYRQMNESGYSWPIIDLRIRYANPSTFQQKINIKATITEWENRLKINYLISDAVTGKRLTKAHSVQVAVDMANGEMCFASPPILFEKLGIEPQ